MLKNNIKTKNIHFTPPETIAFDFFCDMLSKNGNYLQLMEYIL